MSKDTAFNGETTPRHTILCSDSQCLPPGDPKLLCAKHEYPITGKSFIKDAVIVAQRVSGLLQLMAGQLDHLANHISAEATE